MMNVKELIEALNQFDLDTEVVLEGYKANTETENRSYELVHVDGSIDGDKKVSVILWGLLRDESK
jgi:hypothetical protein